MNMPLRNGTCFTSDHACIMTTYISILRGINVSGHKNIRMEDLKAVYEGLDFGEVTTYIQSGNVIFKTGLNLSMSVLSEKIDKAIEEKYHFHVPVIIRTADEMHQILSSNPFLNEEGTDREKLHVTFLEEEPEPTDVSAIQKYDFPPDAFRIIGKEVYLFCPGGYGNTKLSNTFFENKLRVKATTRNWKTVGKLAELADM
jgi:uncharacterized protein (DUF1697 family)